MSGRVEHSRVGDLLQLSLDSAGRRNALSRPMLTELAAALGAVDEAVTGVVISGRGDTFSAGADFTELTGTAADESYDDAVAEVTQAIRRLPRIVVAAIEGACIGAAADLALSCDIRVAAAGSYLQIPAVRLGLLYNPDSILRMRQSIPADVLRRMLLLGERIDAEEARAAGLVSYLAARGEAVSAAGRLLTDITAQQLDAMAATKELLNSDTTSPDRAYWQQRRRRLLDSPQRRAAVEQARRRHLRNDK